MGLDGSKDMQYLVHPIRLKLSRLQKCFFLFVLLSIPFKSNDIASITATNQQQSCFSQEHTSQHNSYDLETLDLSSSEEELFVDAMASSIQDSGSAFQYTKTIPKGGYEDEGKHGNNKNSDSLPGTKTLLRLCHLELT